MTNLSKGDWRYSKEYHEVTTSRVGIIEGSKEICSLATFDKSKEEVEANGLAIAAVPDMVAFLENVTFLDDLDVGADADEKLAALRSKASNILNKISGKG